MTRPEDIPMTTFLVAEDLCKEVVHHWAEGREAIARAIMAAEKRGEDREREACRQLIMYYRNTFEAHALSLAGLKVGEDAQAKALLLLQMAVAIADRKGGA